MGLGGASGGHFTSTNREHRCHVKTLKQSALMDDSTGMNTSSAFEIFCLFIRCLYINNEDGCTFSAHPIRSFVPVNQLVSCHSCVVHITLGW